MSFFTGDSASVNTVSKYSTLVMSSVIGPPEGFCFDLSFLVRSGLIGVQLCPWSVDLKTISPAVYKTLGSCGEITIGYVQAKR